MLSLKALKAFVNMTSQKPRIVFLDAETVDLGDISAKKLQAQGYYRPLFNISREQMSDSVWESEILISNKYFLGESEFAKSPQLKLVCISATGANNVDLEAARKRGIGVCNVAGYSTASVAEHTLMFLLALSHGLMPHHQAAMSGTWSQSPHFAWLNFPYQNLRGKTLGIVGYGDIGREVERLVKPLGMQVLIAKLPGRKYSDRKARLTLSALLKKSDFVTLHSALHAKTQHLINTQTLSYFKTSAYLLNLARGGLVDENALAEALQQGRLAGYASDVMQQEPPPSDHIFFSDSIRHKILLTPHIAWASQESRQNLMDEIAENIAAFKKGKRRNRLD